jgi:hypothetical protein
MTRNVTDGPFYRHHLMTRNMTDGPFYRHQLMTGYMTNVPLYLATHYGMVSETTNYNISNLKLIILKREHFSTLCAVVIFIL